MNKIRWIQWENRKKGGEGNSRNVPLIIQKNDRQKSRRSCINGTMSGETKFVCQRREFRLVVPADGSNEIPRRLKSCQLLSVSLSHSFSFSLLLSSSSFCLIFLLLSRRRLLETLLVRISRDTFRKEITPCRWRGKEKPGKATRFIK